jgi:phosphate uptake regulator
MNELRKVQRTPTGTFFVCLPREWADRHGLQKGSVVAVNEASDGRLFIDPKYNIEPAPRIVTIKPSPYLSREILGKYLLGFDIIRVEAKERISLEMRDTVKKAANQLIGLEIVEEDYSGIVLQCLLEPAGFPPDKILRRNYAIVAGMHRDVVNSFVDGDLQLAQNVIVRDDESNRLYFLLVRILRTIIQNPSLSEKLNVSAIDCLDYRLAASLVEAIGDECVRIALKTIALKGFKIAEEVRKLLVAFHTLCFDAHENALKAFFSGDIATAENIRGMREKIEKDFANIERVARAQSIEIVPQILAGASFLRQIYEHSLDIADLAGPKRS